MLRTSALHTTRRTAQLQRPLSTAARSAASSSSRPLILLASVTLIGAAGAGLAWTPLSAEQSHGAAGFGVQVGKGGAGMQPSVFAWGRNSHNVAAPGLPDTEMIKRPRTLKAFDGQILRDLVLAETYGAAVDENGDVLQWGLGFDPSPAGAAPRKTLQHHNIVKVTANEHKLFALSKNGEVFVIPATLEKQQVGAERRQEGSWWAVWKSKDPGTDVEKLKTDSPFSRGEKIASVSAGTSHLLALTTKGRSFALPLSLSANSYGQLGARHVQLLSLHPTALSAGALSVTLAPAPTINDPAPLPPPPANLDPLLRSSNTPSAPEPLGMPRGAISSPITPIDTSHLVRIHDDNEVQSALERDIRFATTLHEIPSLRGIRIAELAAGKKHSLARLEDGKVLGWGANGYGQLGLGGALAFPSIPVPTEIPLTRCYPKATRIECTRIAAGGNLSYFVVDRTDLNNGRETIDLLASGNGQFGGIGNGTWAHAPSPMRVKTISGLSEFSEKDGKVMPIPIREVSAGNAHIAIVLDNAIEQPGGIKFGRDVFVLGHNMYHQLGTGKRSNLAIPQHLSPLPYPGLAPLKGVAAPATTQEAITESGTPSPMPHSRLQLAPELIVNGKKVEEAIVAGDGGSAVYWRILNP